MIYKSYTCGNGCLCCYANFNDVLRVKNIELRNPDSPLIFGIIDESKDRIIDKDDSEVPDFKKVCK